MNPTATRPPLTTTGEKRLREELQRLRDQIQESSGRLIQELEHNDDPSWYATRGELERVRKRIYEIETALSATHELPGPVDEKAVSLGSQVRVQDEAGAEQLFVIVLPIEADPRTGHISYKSPVGAALVGRRAGESVTVLAPSGERVFNLVSVA